MAFLNYHPPTDPYLAIRYYDDAIIVVDKPAWILSVRGRAPEHQDSIQARITSVFPTAHIVHRLDMATSGLLVIAMNKAASAHLGNQFAARETHKLYYARVIGHPAHSQGQCEAPLIVDWPNRPKQKVCHTQGKPALTDYVCERQDTHTSLMRLTPQTGRSHQLRVHMQHIGHPILGDRLYSAPETYAGIERMHLHATELGFAHPTTGEWMQFTSAHPFAQEPALNAYFD